MQGYEWCPLCVASIIIGMVIEPIFSWFSSVSIPAAVLLVVLKIVCFSFVHVHSVSFLVKFCAAMHHSSLSTVLCERLRYREDDAACRRSTRACVRFSLGNCPYPPWGCVLDPENHLFTASGVSTMNLVPVTCISLHCIVRCLCHKEHDFLC